jgi:hypothetical protein
MPHDSAAAADAQIINRLWQGSAKSYSASWMTKYPLHWPGAGKSEVEAR